MNYYTPRKWPSEKVGEGTVKGQMRRFHVGLDPDTYEYLRYRAMKAGRSFSEEVRLVIEWGLDSANTA